MKKKLFAAALILVLVLCNLQSLSVLAADKDKVKDVYIDNTVDESVTYITGKVVVTDKSTGETKTEEVYSNSASAAYSNPRTSQVQGMLDDCYTKVYNRAKAIKGKLDDGDMAVVQSTGKVWDNRKYTTVEDGDAVLIGDSDYLTGAYGVNDSYTRTHIASGGYGKETFITVTATVEIEGEKEYTVTVTTDYRGTAAASPSSGKKGTKVTLTATPASGYIFREWRVVSGGVTVADNSFTIGETDVKIEPVFEQDIVGFGIAVEGNGKIRVPEFGTETGPMNFTWIKGETITLTAVPDEGSEFVGWYEGRFGDSGFVSSHTDNCLGTDLTWTNDANDSMGICAVFKESHKHTLVKTEEDPAGCEKEGTKAYWTCSECGKLFSDAEGKTEITAPEKIAATGHKWDDGKVTKEASCTKDGEKTYTCTACGATKTEVIPATDHDWSEWTIVKEPTETEDGQKVRTCKNNKDEVQVEPVPKLEVSYSVKSGDGSTWTIGSTDPLVFRAERSVNDDKTFGLFTGVTVDGTAVEESNFTAEAGSVIITLNASYLETLNAGNHTLAVSFEDGEAGASFTVKEKKSESKPAETNTSDSTKKKDNGSSAGSKPTVPSQSTKSAATGDAGHAVFWGMLMMAALIAMVMAFAGTTKRSR